jgi:hypothetical protein
MKRRESMQKLRICGNVHSQYIPTEEVMHFFIKDMDGADLPGGPFNGRILKHYVSNE